MNIIDYVLDKELPQRECQTAPQDAILKHTFLTFAGKGDTQS